MHKVSLTETASGATGSSAHHVMQATAWHTHVLRTRPVPAIWPTRMIRHFGLACLLGRLAAHNEEGFKALQRGALNRAMLPGLPHIEVWNVPHWKWNVMSRMQNIASWRSNLFLERRLPRCRRATVAGFALTFVVGFVLAANADNIPDDELAIINEIHENVWGHGSWGQPRAPRDEAAKIFDSVLKRVASVDAKALAWELRADYFRAIGDHAESMKASRVIYDSFPESSRTPNAAAELIARSQAMGDYGAMLSFAHEQLTRTTDPQRVLELTTAAAQAFRGMGDWMAARGELVGLLDRFPEHSHDIQTSLLRLASDATAIGDHAAAQGILSEIHSATPADQRKPALYGNLAVASIMTGRKDHAVRYHEEAIERFPLDPRRASHELSLGILYLDLGNDERARMYFQAVLDSNATFEGIDKAREVARASLQEIAARAALQMPEPLDRDPADWRRVFLLVLNGAIVIAVVMALGWRRFHLQRKKG